MKRLLALPDITASYNVVKDIWVRENKIGIFQEGYQLSAADELLRIQGYGVPEI